MHTGKSTSVTLISGHEREYQRYNCRLGPSNLILFTTALRSSEHSYLRSSECRCSSVLALLSWFGGSSEMHQHYSQSGSLFIFERHTDANTLSTDY